MLADSRDDDVLRVYGESTPFLVWANYSEQFNWWGEAESKHRRLQSSGVPLIHAYLGPESHQHYLVPDCELTERTFHFGIQHKDGSRHRKIQADHGTPPNRSSLEQYTDLCACIAEIQSKPGSSR